MIRWLLLVGGIAVIAAFPVLVALDYLTCRLLGIRASWGGSVRATWRSWRHSFWRPKP